MAVKLPIGDVVDRGTGASHQKSAEREDRQLPEVWETMGCLDKGGPTREERQPYSDRAIQPRQPCIWPPCGRQPAIHPVATVDIAEIGAAQSRHDVIQISYRKWP
jgi:hypothetical protein